ncbi:MAG TPA: MarP family serine protease [Candidatus Dormibacteraeota bacterium]|nr:MarP family serine protease [Candidatus Dormibacteraeota bacterium]
MRTFTGINLIDFLIIVALLIGLANGYRRGFWLSLTQYVGLVAGVVAGAALAPGILSALQLPGAVKPLAAALVLVIFGSLGSTLGYMIGEPMRRALRGPGLTRPPEKLAGSLFSAFAVLSVAWFLGLTFSRGPSPEVGRLIERSAILRPVDVLFPRPPGFLTGVSGILAGVPFPPAFAVLEQPPLDSLQPPASVDTPGVTAATRSVFRVEGRGCGGQVSGSAYPVAPGYLVTNAHVVSGTANTRLSQSAGRPGGVPATVVLFDPGRDVAILWAPQAGAAVLPAGSGQRGTQAAVIGYPGGGGESVSPAVIEKSTSATGRDIYNDALVDRNIWILSASVHPGNSGGPVVDLQGNVLGLIFAASSTDPSQAYALTNEEIDADVRAGVGRTARVDTSAYRCAV